MALCRLHRTLLVVEGNVLDLNDPASRLLARLQAGVAAYENDLRTRTLVASKYAKARLGHAVSRPPGGFVVSTKGQWVKDPDHAVQQAIEQVLGLFRQLGSVPQVLRALVRAKAMLPRPDQRGRTALGTAVHGPPPHDAPTPSLRRLLHVGPAAGHSRGS
ncbi:MAG: hypothetical protein M5R38_03770 [Candidatus Methylomirabilis sp.]|nr:hypothetical protein [Candidatus Methylomirabilis sp.]